MIHTLSRPLTESQEVSRNRCLNTAFELSLIRRLYKYLLFWRFSELIELLSLKTHVTGKSSDISVLIIGVLKSLLKIEFVIMTNSRYCFICHSSGFIYCRY